VPGLKIYQGDTRLKPDEKKHLTQSGYSKVFVLLPMNIVGKQLLSDIQMHSSEDINAK